LARNTGWLAAGGVVSALLGAGLTAVTARMLGSVVFGELALAVATAGVVLQFADFRTWEVAVKLIPTSESGYLTHDSGPVVQALVLADLGAGIFGMIAAWLLASAWGRMSGEVTAVPALMRTYAFAVPWILLSSGACLGVLRLADKFRLLTIKSVVLAVVQFAVVLSALRSGLGAGAVVWAYVVVEFVNAAVTIVIVARLLRSRGLGIVPEAWSRIRASLAAGRPLLGQMWLSGTIKGLATRLDIPLLGLLSSTTAVANYRLAQDLAGVLSRLGNPVQQAILPEMVALENKGDRVGLRRLAWRSTLVLAIPIVPALVLIAATSPTILRLAAGPEFTGAATVFALVALGVGVNTMLVWSRPLLVARMRVGWGNLIAVIAGLVQLAVIATFAGREGAVAAAAGNASMLLISSVAGAIAGLR
jgi:O-antigen/teichoic acid export membrane protein